MVPLRERFLATDVQRRWDKFVACKAEENGRSHSNGPMYRATARSKLFADYPLETVLSQTQNREPDCRCVVSPLMLPVQRCHRPCLRGRLW